MLHDSYMHDAVNEGWEEGRTFEGNQYRKNFDKSDRAFWNLHCVLLGTGLLFIKSF